MSLRNQIAHRLCALLDDDWSLGKKLYLSEADAILALVHAEVERLREALQDIADLPSGCIRDDPDDVREMARQALKGATHD